MFLANAAVGVRMSLAISRMIEDGLLMFARGGQFATGSVDFTARTSRTERSASAGHLVQASKSGRLFVLTSAVAFGATDTGPLTAAIQAIAYGYEYNVPGEFTAANGELLPGEIDTIWLSNSIDAGGIPTFDKAARPQQVESTPENKAQVKQPVEREVIFEGLASFGQLQALCLRGRYQDLLRRI